MKILFITEMFPTNIHRYSGIFILELLKRLDSWLKDSGTFLMIDALLIENDISYIHRKIVENDQGKYWKTADENKEIIGKQFIIKESNVKRIYSFISHKYNPLFNDILTLECGKKK